MSEPPPNPATRSPTRSAAIPHDQQPPRESDSPVRRHRTRRQSPLELYQVVIDCRDEAEQRAWYERLRGEGARLRLQVL
jgi:hypothetical protein